MEKTPIYKHSMVGPYLAKRRLDKGMTQLELSQKLGYTSPQFVSNWERGLCSPPLQVLPKLCITLKIPKREMIEVLTKEYRFHVESSLGQRRV